MQGCIPHDTSRLPMGCSGEDNAEFNGSRPWWSPEAVYLTVNVEAQTNDPDLMLSYWRTPNLSRFAGKRHTTARNRIYRFIALRYNLENKVHEACVLLGEGEVSPYQ